MTNDCIVEDFHIFVRKEMCPSVFFVEVKKFGYKEMIVVPSLYNDDACIVKSHSSKEGYEEVVGDFRYMKKGSYKFKTTSRYDRKIFIYEEN